MDNAIYRLAEDYDHLAWYLDPATSKTVDGQTYDLTALKAQYGDLYRFVEPLSNEEVEQRFEYLVNYLIDRENADNSDGYKYSNGLEENIAGVDYLLAYRERNWSTMLTLINSTDSKLNMYAKYYFTFENRYGVSLPDSFSSKQTSPYTLGKDIM